ncbi:hypothetical protein T05_16528 [Trichinella murrelli]|uniref:Uncharacterized protein n=1 Tax=Trichinella murrelli TaxID=144512 RepID=A0A0V0TPS6_9BILA|nr:hypothetical protein T05_16528 [Trichinella murrelli]
MKARCQLLLLNAEWEHNLQNSIFTSSDMKQRDCGKVLRSYLVAPFSAMSRGVSWSSIIPVILKSDTEFPFLHVPNNLSPCQVLIRTVLLACVVRQHNGKIEWMPAPFFLCRLPPEICSNPCACCCVADCECKTTTKLRNVQS